MSLIKKLKSAYSNYDTSTGATFGVVLGIGAGVVAGLALPPYIGWKIGDYIAKAVEFGPTVSSATKLIGAVGVSSATYSFVVPGAVIGGAAVGAGICAGLGKVKESLEKLVSKSK